MIAAWRAGRTAVSTRADVLGVLSLIVWALILVVTIKYVLFLLRADNKGEGGTLSADGAGAARARRERAPIVIAARRRSAAALFYGDAIITPAISVLSAVEGLKLVDAGASSPTWCRSRSLILIGLFAVQRLGTAKVAALFGPIMVVVVPRHGGAGVCSTSPTIRACCWRSTRVYGVVFLIQHRHRRLRDARRGVPGRHRRRGALCRSRAISAASRSRSPGSAFVFPALVLNYFGQGALVLKHPDASTIHSSCCHRTGRCCRWCSLATAATVIASQAVITGAFSLTQQAIQLGLLPRMDIRYTSETHAGQIYMPQVNLLLLIGVLLLVVMFRSSVRWPSAYGIAVTGDDGGDGLLAFIVIWRLWRWQPGRRCR